MAHIHGTWREARAFTLRNVRSRPAPALLGCGLTPSGVAYRWGINNVGELGTGSAVMCEGWPQWSRPHAQGHHQRRVIAATRQGSFDVGDGRSSGDQVTKPQG